MPENLDKVVNAFVERTEQQHFTKLASNADVLENESNLSVSSYVEQEDKREKIDIEEVEESLNNIVDEGMILRAKINEIVKGL